jgi:hypothetical protein
MLALAILAGCGELGEPEANPARVVPVEATRARSWVRTVVSDGQHLFWMNYDVSTGRSARTTLDRAPIAGGEPVELAEERHPPDHLAVGGGHVYWLYDGGALKRVPVDGGPVEVVQPRVEAACFAVDASGLYTIEGAKVLRRTAPDWAPVELASNALGDCPVVLDGHVFWNERKGLHRVPVDGGERVKLAELRVPKGLRAFDGELYTCIGDLLTAIDPASGATRPVRSYCKADGLTIGENGHWFRAPHFVGWPPAKQYRIAEVTRDGVSYLFDGEGASTVVVTEGRLAFFGRPVGGTSDWVGYTAPLP